MDNKKILILNLSKGRIGEDNSALLGAMMITKIQLAAMARADQPEHERQDFYLFIDEFQNFTTDAFASLLFLFTDRVSFLASDDPLHTTLLNGRGETVMLIK